MAQADIDPAISALLERRLNAIRKRFVEAAPLRISQLQAHVSAAAAGGPEATQALDEIATIAHTLAGTAATLNLTEIDLLSRRIDRTIKEANRAGHGSERRWASVGADAVALIDALDALRSEANESDARA